MNTQTEISKLRNELNTFKRIFDLHVHMRPQGGPAPKIGKKNRSDMTRSELLKELESVDEYQDKCGDR